VTLEFGIILLV